MRKKQERALEIAAHLKRMYPKAKCSLDFTNPFELLIATMLSAQSTDARVNIVTKSLFRKYPDAATMARASQVEMERDVKQTGFFRNKAKAVIAASKAIVEKHGGEVPDTMEADELQRTIDQAEEIAPCCDHPLVVPKCSGVIENLPRVGNICDIEQFKKAIHGIIINKAGEIRIAHGEHIAELFREPFHFRPIRRRFF